MKTKRILVAIAVLFSCNVFSQVTKRTCLTHELHLKLLANDNTYKVRRNNLKIPTPPTSQGEKKITSQTVYTIPVVVHIIHNGEAIGDGPNISEAQINSAIIALTEDFRALNADTLGPSHAFYSLQADVGLKFCLAKQDPQGAATTGIVRYDKGRSGWEAADFDANVKPTTIWDISKYMNIWITTFTGEDDSTLGYATFPGSTRTSEVGIVIGAMFFGTTGNLSAIYNKNRTATHEVGHFFNLFHIWGDETCGDDLVSDTPTQQEPNTDLCPSFPHNVGGTCNPGANGEMFMNYMDYTTDGCMQLFSIGQRDRMRSALQLSDRIGLTTSIGCVSSTNLEHLSLKDVSIYPNPTNDIATISLNGNNRTTTVTVYNLSGQNMSSTVYTNTGNIILNTSSLSNGTYIISVTTETGTVNKTLVILK
jgi:hypothetical protein